jgi:hypothetical protein
MSSVNVTRREFLCRVLALLGIWLCYGKKRRPESTPLDDFDELPRRLAGLFTHKKSAAIIGTEYLRRAPEEADIRRLAESICPGAARRAQLALAGDIRLRQWVRARQTKDFEEGRRVRIDGWILSVTEARLCALVALI